jgi:hypothetical protein
MRWRVSPRQGIWRRDTFAARGVGIGKQTVGQNRLCLTGLFKKFRDLELVEAAVRGSLPFVTYQ